MSPIEPAAFVRALLQVDATDRAAPERGRSLHDRVEQLRVALGPRAPVARTASALAEEPGISPASTVSVVRAEPERRSQTSPEPRADDPRPVAADLTTDLATDLRHVQALMVRHREAVTAAAAALIAEGRRFAATSEGRRWSAALAGSELIRRGRPVWEALGLKVFAPGEASRSPVEILDTFVRTMRSPVLEGMLADLFMTERAADAADGPTS